MNTVKMSAAAGISAAKKRRGVVASPETSQTQQQKQAPMVTPIQILQNHELRLKHIEKQLNDAEQYANSMVEQEQAQVKQAPQQQQPQQQQQQQKHNQQALDQTNHLLQLYKAKSECLEGKCDALEKKVEELTQLIQKVQTFSMETNLSFLKVKRLFDEDFETRIQELKKYYVTTDNMNIMLETIKQDVKQDTASTLASLSAVSSFTRQIHQHEENQE
jgi:hypothetical protein